MKDLYLCRHAKSSWAEAGIADHDRTLNERGIRDVATMADRFVEQNGTVDLLLSSTAKRAFATAIGFARALGFPQEAIEKQPRIYEASSRTLLKLIEELPDDRNGVILFGHNPGISETIGLLTGDPVGDLPTCAIARIELEIDRWKEVVPGIGRLKWLDYPKMEG